MDGKIPWQRCVVVETMLWRVNSEASSCCRGDDTVEGKIAGQRRVVVETMLWIV